jgi:hypothetical protein
MSILGRNAPEGRGEGGSWMCGSLLVSRLHPPVDGSISHQVLLMSFIHQRRLEMDGKEATNFPSQAAREMAIVILHLAAMQYQGTLQGCRMPVSLLCGNKHLVEPGTSPGNAGISPAILTCSKGAHDRFGFQSLGCCPVFQTWCFVRDMLVLAVAFILLCHCPTRSTRDPVPVY